MSFRKPISFVLFLVLTASIFTVPAFAAEEKADSGSAWNIYFRPGVRFGTESRVLYIMDFLIPLYQDENNIFFSNIKYTPNDRDGWELNVGAGYRRLLWEEKLLLGLNAYYDKRRTDWGTNHEQWGVGLEAMADIPLEPFNLGLTGRFNYYYPLSHTRIEGVGTPYASYTLSDSGIILNGGRVEEPMRGFDYEAGVRIPYISDYVETWTYVGGYHYKGRRVRDINGFVARLEVIPTDFMRLNYEFHHDNYESGEHYGEVTFEVPFSVGNLVTGKNPFEGIGDVFTGSRELSARMVEPTRRDVDVKVIVDEDNGNVPGGGEEIEDIVFVSETGSDATGNGTIDNPYATISYALANDPRILSGNCKTIHVMNSSTVAVVDEAAGAGLTLGISDFLLWGSGVNHPKYPVSNMPYTGRPTVNDTLVIDATNPEVTGVGFDVNGSNYCIDIRDGAAGSGIRITNNSFKMLFAGTAGGVYLNFVPAGMDIGTEANPAIIANNSFDIESTGSNAYGINLRTTGDIFAKIIGNDMSNTITGDGDTYGIWLYSSAGNIGSETSPAIISGNPITATSNSLDAYGIDLVSFNDLFAVVTKNDMSNTITGSSDTFGIYLYSTNGNIGSEDSPVIISSNPMTVTSNTWDATGITVAASNNVFATIIGNDMSNTITGADYAEGIYLYSVNGNIGSETSPVIISGNPMTVTANAWDANGIVFAAFNDIFVTITGNDMSNTITGEENANGIYLYSSSGNIGSETRPVIISGNPMTVTANTLDAYGIYLDADLDIFTTITGNDLSNTITGDDYAAGIYLHADGGTMGSETRPIIVSSNLMSVTANTWDAAGIIVEAFNDVFATVTGNDLSNTIIGEGYADGISLFSLTGNMGSETRPVIVLDNPMTVTANTYDAFGVGIEASGNVFASIAGNNMSVYGQGDDFTSGIYLYSDSGNIGSQARPVIVSGNPMTVTSIDWDAYGIYFDADLDIFATITGNDMSNTITAEGYAEGIYLYSDSGNIGSATSPVIISGNPMTVTSLGYDAYGIDIYGDINIFATITGNDMSNTITGDAYAGGIYLHADRGTMGSETRPVIVSSNPMTVTANNDNAAGMVIEAYDDVFATITGNDMSNTITGGDYAYGIYFYSYRGGMGSETSPVVISGNHITATSFGDDSYGIRIEAWDDIFATIIGNNMPNIISNATDDDGNGIYIITSSGGVGGVGSVNSPVIISGNSMKVTGTDDGYGIKIDTFSDVFATITGNDMSGGIWSKGNVAPADTNDAFGVEIISSDGSIGSETNPVIISGNHMTVTADNDDAFGIFLNADDDIFATITENNLSIGSQGDNSTVGIFLYSDVGNIGSETRPVIISSNPITVTANTWDAWGIFLESNLDMFASIAGNDMSNGIYGGDYALGIYLISASGSIGSETKPVLISKNPMSVTANTWDAYGVYLDADIDIFANFKRNYMSIVSTSAEAYGGYMEAGNLIGDITSIATFFYKNSGTINGAIGRYMLYLETGVPGGGNYVRWGGNGFTPVGGAWSGNYGTLNQVWHNFTIPPDVLTP